MKQLMTRHFSKWAKKQRISIGELSKALDEIKIEQLNIAVKNGDFVEVVT